MGHSATVMSLDFHPNKDDLICSCDGDGEIRYWSINNGSCARVFKVNLVDWDSLGLFFGLLPVLWKIQHDIWTKNSSLGNRWTSWQILMYNCFGHIRDWLWKRISSTERSNFSLDLWVRVLAMESGRNGPDEISTTSWEISSGCRWECRLDIGRGDPGLPNHLAGISCWSYNI